MRSNYYVSSVLLILTASFTLGLSMTFSSCSKLKSGMAVEGMVNVNNSGQIVEWSYGNGTVSPNYQYGVAYKLNLSNKLFELTIRRGSSVTVTLPSAKQKTISDSELTQMKKLLSELTFRPCSAGSMSIGGGSELISISSAVTLTPTHQIFATDCTGYGTSTSFQSIGGFENIKTHFMTF